jgi:DNA-binding response OmpR family regulator
MADLLERSLLIVEDSDEDFEAFRRMMNKTLPPILILTGEGNEEIAAQATKHSEQDILKSYKLGANYYITKPIGLREFEQIVRSIENFWLTVVKLPKLVL